MKTLNGYKLIDKQPEEGDKIYSLNVQCFSTVTKLSDGALIFYVPGFKWSNRVDGSCIVVEKSPKHSIIVSDHQREVYHMVEIN